MSNTSSQEIDQWHVFTIAATIDAKSHVIQTTQTMKLGQPDLAKMLIEVDSIRIAYPQNDASDARLVSQRVEPHGPHVVVLAEIARGRLLRSFSNRRVSTSQKKPSSHHLFLDSQPRKSNR